MARVPSSDEEAPSGEFHDKIDDVLALTAYFQRGVGRIPRGGELLRLGRRRAAHSWRIAPPRGLTGNSRVIARPSQPSRRRGARAPGGT